MLLGIILLPLLARFSLICRMWAFPISMLSAFEASGLGFCFGLTPRAWVFHRDCLIFEPGKWACAPIFQTLSVGPQLLCTVCVGKGCNVSHIGCDFHVSARGWII